MSVLFGLLDKLENGNARFQARIRAHNLSGLYLVFICFFVNKIIVRVMLKHRNLNQL